MAPVTLSFDVSPVTWRQSGQTAAWHPGATAVYTLERGHQTHLEGTGHLCSNAAVMPQRGWWHPNCSRWSELLHCSHRAPWRLTVCEPAPRVVLKHRSVTRARGLSRSRARGGVTSGGNAGPAWIVNPPQSHERMRADVNWMMTAQ